MVLLVALVSTPAYVEKLNAVMILYVGRMVIKNALINTSWMGKAMKVKIIIFIGTVVPVAIAVITCALINYGVIS
jgi:hypothetical protein